MNRGVAVAGEYETGWDHTSSIVSTTHHQHHGNIIAARLSADRGLYLPRIRFP